VDSSDSKTGAKIGGVRAELAPKSARSGRLVRAQISSLFIISRRQKLIIAGIRNGSPPHR